MPSSTKWKQELPTDALFKRERDVLDRWDKGQSPDVIAAELGISAGHVFKIVELYDDCGAGERAMRADAIRGSAALAAACAATGGRFA
jgi:DNA-binding NarL/FixJ family response regulator